MAELRRDVQYITGQYQAGASTNVVNTDNGYLYVARQDRSASPFSLMIYRSTDRGNSWSLYYRITDGTSSISAHALAARGNILFASTARAFSDFTVIGIDTSVVASGTLPMSGFGYTSTTQWKAQQLGYGYPLSPTAFYCASDWNVYFSFWYYDDAEQDRTVKVKYATSGYNVNMAVSMQGFVEYGGRLYGTTYLGLSLYYWALDGDVSTNYQGSLGIGGARPRQLFAHSDGYLYGVFLNSTSSPWPLYIYRWSGYPDGTNTQYLNSSGNWVSTSNTSAMTGGSLTTKQVYYSSLSPSGKLTIIIRENNVIPVKFARIVVQLNGTASATITDMGDFYIPYAEMGYNFDAQIYDANTLYTNMQMSSSTKLYSSFSVNIGSPSVPFTRWQTYVEPFNTAPNAPTNFKVNGLGDNSAVNTKRPTLTWTFSDPDGGDTQSRFSVAVSNDNFATWYTQSGDVTSSSGSWTVGVDLPDGVWQFAVQTADSSDTYGNWSYLNSVRVNTVAPTASSVDGTNYTTGATRFSIYGVSDSGSGVQKVQIYLRNRADINSVWLVDSGQCTNAGGGTWYYDLPVPSDGNGQHLVRFHILDNAGNWSAAYDTWWYYDTVTPTSPTQTNGVLYATSNGVSWSAFNDPAPSSGLLLTTLYLQQWNGSSWANVLGYPKSVVGLTNSLTGLTPATQYRWGVTYMDNAGNVSTLNYTTFTTNSYSVSTSVNLSASGYTLNKRPKFKFTVTDANDATLTNFQIQVSAVNDFSSTIIDTSSSAVSSGWSAASLPSGSTGYYTPQADLTTGARYVRIRAYDGKDWGTWSATSMFTIQAVSWPTVIATDDTAISKRTIDDLRTKVNAIRQARGLAAAAWTDASIQDWTNGASATNVRAVHLIELRQAITDIYTALSTAAPSWASDTVIDTTKNRKGQHWLDLRTALLGT